MSWRQVPEADHEPLKALIEELKGIGWPTSQWGDSGVVFTPTGSYRTAFFETFGVKEGFIRGEGASVLVAAQKAIEKIKRQAACSHPDDSWRYTHENGYKTCGKCGYFAACKVEEALAHYDHGEVKLPDRSSYLMFDFRRPLCPTCGGHILAKDYVFDIYRCECGQRLESVHDDIGAPERDENGYPLLRSLDVEPQVVGFWNPAKGKWLGEDNHIKTYRLADIKGWRRRNIARHLEQEGAELRLVNLDHSPGDVVPFTIDWKKEVREFKTAMQELVEALAPEATPVDDQHPKEAEQL